MSTQEKAKAQIVNFKVVLGHLRSNAFQKNFETMNGSFFLLIACDPSKSLFCVPSKFSPYIFDVIFLTRKTVFDQISKHREES